MNNLEKILGSRYFLNLYGSGLKIPSPNVEKIEVTE